MRVRTTCGSLRVRFVIRLKDFPFLIFHFSFTIAGKKSNADVHIDIGVDIDVNSESLNGK
jgi:hypothetical protein